MVLHVVRFGICILLILVGIVSDLNYNVWSFVSSVRDTLKEHLQLALERTGIWIDELKTYMLQFESVV